jgi:phosphopantothenate-cysteine ligase/phosphopantothenoylcysteine decarboxylase/phosphopantothenate--cysteine ligase
MGVDSQELMPGRLSGGGGMNILVTAGNTQTPIDRVRCITNIFSGRTGARIALAAHDRGHRVTLLTSRPDAVNDLPRARDPVPPTWELLEYRTFDDLDAAMGRLVAGGGFDAVVHSAAVSDYHVTGAFVRDGTEFVDVSAGKVKGSHPELWLRLVPAPKLVDKVRREWGFRGRLVKFKLEVGAGEAELLAIAERSRLQSAADLMVANTLDGMHDWAVVGNAAGYRRVGREELPAAVLDSLA